MKLRIAAIADLHGDLPSYMPECDLLIIAGDICPDFARTGPFAEQQARWLKKEFGPWLYGQRHCYQRAVLTWGNHDHVGVLLRDFPDVWMPAHQRTQVEVCIDSLSRHAQALGLRVWCSPWSLRFYDWAWMARDTDLELVYSRIPNDLDILVTHGPPANYCDQNDRRDRCGSQALHDRLREMGFAAPKTVVCGHIHEGRGQDYISETRTAVFNVSAFVTGQPVCMVPDPFVAFEVEAREQG